MSMQVRIEFELTLPRFLVKLPNEAPIVRHGALHNRLVFSTKFRSPIS